MFSLKNSFFVELMKITDQNESKINNKNVYCKSIKFSLTRKCGKSICLF